MIMQVKWNWVLKNWRFSTNVYKTYHGDWGYIVSLMQWLTCIMLS